MPVLERAFDQWKSEYTASKDQFSFFELAKERASYFRWRSIENADKLLIEFESNFQKQGGRVIWAPEANDALNEIEYIINKHQQSKILKSKSNICEEIGLSNFLKSKKYQYEESNLGNYIQSLSEEKSFHPISPAMHQSKEYIGRLFHNKMGTPFRAHPSLITEAFADYINETLADTKITITGANFLISDTGSIALSENEGNINLITSIPQVVIIVAGIDKILSSVNDLDVLWPMLSSHETGERLSAYNTLLSGPTGTGEDGPNEVYLILLDNGRSNQLAHAEQRQAMHCIGCGACHQVCPVYKRIGGQSYETAITGPIGLVSNSLLDSNRELKSQVYASPACGKCNEVCPVNIDLAHLISSVRNVQNLNDATIQEKYGWLSWKKMMLKRKRMNQNNALKSFMLKTMHKRNWGDQREFPEFSERSFNQLWIDIKGIDEGEDKII